MEFDYNDRVDFSDRPSTAIVQNTSHNIFFKNVDNNNNKKKNNKNNNNNNNSKNRNKNN